MVLEAAVTERERGWEEASLSCSSEDIELDQAPAIINTLIMPVVMTQQIIGYIP